MIEGIGLGGRGGFSETVLSSGVELGTMEVSVSDSARLVLEDREEEGGVDVLLDAFLFCQRVDTFFLIPRSIAMKLAGKEPFPGEIKGSCSCKAVTRRLHRPCLCLEVN